MKVTSSFCLVREQICRRLIAERLVRPLVIVQVMHSTPIKQNRARFCIHGIRYTERN